MEFRANEVILCCGAIHSPAVLLRAGIGPVGHLRELGIPVRANRPGVGQRLMDHPSISVASYLKPGARKNPYSKRSLHLGMRFSSGIDGAPAGDMALTASNKSAWHAIGDRIAVITLWVNKTFSETGQVRLATADWRQEPMVDFNLLSDHRDLMRLARGFRQIAALHELPPLQGRHLRRIPCQLHRQDPPGRHLQHQEPDTDQHRRGTAWTVRRFCGSSSFGASSWSPPSLVKALQDDDALETYIRRAAVGVWHCSCSCRMGAEDDPMAVTDQVGQGARRARTARGRCFDLPGGALCEHQLPDHDGGGKDRGRHAAGGAVSCA